ncbi:MAG: MBL fold metallo-hydrolase, partial [Rikenellaceae bacterium]|nr:MBL fold metallo-hydrolase [Rikenellaceae bacterium]
MKITYLGHACFTIEAGGVKLLVDPFLKHNPNYCDALWEQAARPDYILVTHGHGDHVGDTIEIAARSGATLISNFEICNWLHAAGVERFIDLNPGGTATLADGGVTVTMTPAIHSSSMASEG